MTLERPLGDVWIILSEPPGVTAATTTLTDYREVSVVDAAN
jgi:hypothetical protein